jgi:uncharacterized membrane protein
MECKLTAMSTFIAASALLFLLVGIWALLERTHRRTAGLPRMPFGADADRDIDLWRVRHDLDVTRSAR